MNTQKLNTFIRNIEEEYSLNEAYIGFFYDENGHDFESYIKANKEGLMLYANELLKASLSIQEKDLNNNDIYEISYEVNLKYSEFKFSYIELFNNSKSKLEEPKEYRQTIGEQVGCFVSIIVAFFALISMLVGAYTIISGIFK